MQTPSIIPAYAHINVTLQNSPARSGRERYIGYGCFLIIFFSLTITVAKAQSCTRQVRKYANMERVNKGLLTDVENNANAINGDPATYSTLKRLAGVGNLVTVTQFLAFDIVVTAGTPVSIKLTFPAAVLSLLGGVEVQPFTGLQNNLILGWQATAAGKSWTDNELLSLINGAGDMEITIVPQTSAGVAVAYEGVWVRLKGVAVGQSLNLFHAYIYQNAISAIDCETSSDVLAGVRAGTVVGGIANATGGISNSSDPLGTLGTAKWAAVDNDPAPYATYAQLNTGAQVLSEVYLTAILSTPSVAGDSIRIVLQDPGGILLNLSLLNGVIVQPYLGAVAAGPASSNTSALLVLNLLPGAADKVVLTAPVSAAFDRIEVKIGGVVGALQSVRIYDINRKTKLPAVDFKVNTSTVPAEVCFNQSAGFAISINNAESCATYAWYDAGNNMVTTGVTPNGLSFTPAITAAGTYNYTIKASRTGCSNAAVQSPISYTIHPTPATPVVPPVTVCTGSSATLTLTNPESGIDYYWYSTATGETPPSNPISSGTSFTTGTPPPFSTYYVAAYNPLTHCISDSRGQGSITVHPKPGHPDVSIHPNP